MPSDTTQAPKSALRLSIQYAIDLALAYILAAVDAVAILIPLRGHTSTALSTDFAEKNTGLVAFLILLGIAAVAVGGAAILAPTLRWYVAGDEPTEAQRDAAMKLRQAAIDSARRGLGRVCRHPDRG